MSGASLAEVCEQNVLSVHCVLAAVKHNQQASKGVGVLMTPSCCCVLLLLLLQKSPNLSFIWLQRRVGAQVGGCVYGALVALHPAAEEHDLTRTASCNAFQRHKQLSIVC